MPLEFDPPSTSNLVFDEPATSRPAGGPSSRARQVVETAQKLFQEPSTRSVGERTFMGGVTGAMAPELTAMTGMGLQLFPYTRPAGMLLQKLAPSLGAVRGRTAALGAAGGAAGGTAEEAATRAGLSPEASRAIGTGTEFAVGTLPIGGLAARATRPPAPFPARPTEVQAREIGGEAIAEAERRAAQTTAQAREAAVPRFRAQRQEQRAAEQTVRQEEQALSLAPTEARVGDMMLETIDRNIGGLRDARKAVADQMYEAADAAMTAKYRAGDFWQNSPSGREFLRKLENRISARGGTTEVTTEEENLIRNALLPNLRGRMLPDQPPSALLGPTGEPARGAVTARYAPSEPNVLRETLRKLRDASRGLPEEGYKAIGQARAGTLADELAESLAKWEGSLAQADARYREMSEVLRPILTRRGRATMAPERFSAEELAIDPASLPRMFFSSPQSVQQLRALTGNNTTAIDRLASLHVATNLRNKTPAQARKWLQDNEDWLNPQVLPEPYRIAEGIVTRLEGATAQAESARRSARGTVERFVGTAREQRKAAETARKTIDEAVRTLDVADPAKLPQAWGQIRGKLESSGVIASADLDRLGAEIQRAALAERRRERREIIIRAITKYAPRGALLLGAYQGYGALRGGQ